jgi:MFS family permease
LYVRCTASITHTDLSIRADIIFELPSNIVLRKVGARNLLGTIAVLWGAAMLGMAFVTDWKQLVAVRVILGFFESGFFPGCVFLISTWYTRWETQKVSRIEGFLRSCARYNIFCFACFQRLASFYLLSMAISGFSQIICYGFAEIKPAGKLNTWRWIFFLFGVITIALGIAGLLLIVDFPDKAKFLNEEERKFIIDRVNVDRGDGTADVMTKAKVFRHLFDWRTWCFGLCFMSATLPVSDPLMDLSL